MARDVRRKYDILLYTFPVAGRRGWSLILGFIAFAVEIYIV